MKVISPKGQHLVDSYTSLGEPIERRFPQLEEMYVGLIDVQIKHSHDAKNKWQSGFDEPTHEELFSSLDEMPWHMELSVTIR